MINKVILVGRLTKNVELNYSSNGIAVATFNLAVNRNFTNAQGTRDADFINCVVWRKQAETFAKYTHKGSLIGIEGRIQTRNYEGADGKRVYVTEVLVENFSFLDSKKSDNSSADIFSGTTVKDQNLNPFKIQNNESNVLDEDLPF